MLFLKVFENKFQGNEDMSGHQNVEISSRHRCNVLLASGRGLIHNNLDRSFLKVGAGERDTHFLVSR